MAYFWFMIVDKPRVHSMRAEEPCMKGEIQILWFVFGWQRKSKRGEG